MTTDPEPTIEVSMPLHLPAHVELPMRVDDHDHLIPATGVVWNKYLDYDTLRSVGVDVVWRDLNGQIVPLERVMALMEAAKEREAKAQAAAGPRAVLKA